MQTRLILLVSLIASYSASKVIDPRIKAPTRRTNTATKKPQNPANPTIAPAPHDIPNFWRMKILNGLNIDSKYIMTATAVTEDGKNYMKLANGSRIQVMLDPIGNDGVLNDAVNKNYNIRLSVPLRFGYQDETENTKKIFGSEFNRSFSFSPSQSFVYTSQKGNFSTLPLWGIDYNKKVEANVDIGGYYTMIFSIRKIDD